MDPHYETNDCDLPPTAEEFENERKLAEAMRRLDEAYSERVRNHERRMEEADSKRGLLEILFGYRTRVW